MRPPPRTSLAAVALAATVLVACGSGDDPTLAPPDSPGDSAPTAATDPGTATPEAGAASSLWHGTVATVSGGEVDLGTYAGRDVAVWFWAPW